MFEVQLSAKVKLLLVVKSIENGLYEVTLVLTSIAGTKLPSSFEIFGCAGVTTKGLAEAANAYVPM